MTAHLLFLFLFFTVPDSGRIDRMLREWRPVKMPFDASSLSSRERQMVDKLVGASRSMESIYWRQSDPEGLKLLHSATDPKLKTLLMINGSRYDLIDDNKPFATDGPISPGRGIYPQGLTRNKSSST